MKALAPTQATPRYWTGAGLAFAAALLAAALAHSALAATRTEATAFQELVRWGPLIFTGFLFNLLVATLAMALGTFAGAVLGLGQVSPVRALAVGSDWTTQFFRNAPWLVLLFYCIFLIPYEVRIGGVTIPFPAWVKAVIGLGLPVMANVSEIVRGAVLSIPTGQWESAASLAFNRRQTLWRIILPQCVKRMLPPWMNLYAILTTSSPLISIVGVQDGMTQTRAALTATNRPDLMLPFYLFLLLLFFLYCYPIARATRALEAKFAVKG
ncbi:MAG: amino acid ABC transporter permease [Burkholderiales bacterium]|nr:amino acid ABC transporter permease [Burkholderiales bacterium]